jgi:hypothetical protein
VGRVGVCWWEGLGSAATVWCEGGAGRKPSSALYQEPEWAQGAEEEEVGGGVVCVGGGSRRCQPLRLAPCHQKPEWTLCQHHDYTRGAECVMHISGFPLLWWGLSPTCPLLTACQPLS